MAKCKPCSGGKHDDDCEHLACTCWCISQAVPFRGPANKAPEPRSDLTEVLALMRASKVVSRTTTEEQVVYRPRPALLDPDLRQMIRLQAVDLARVLAAFRDTQPVSRPLWSGGSLVACYGCKLSCCTIDPLGQPRHVWCGWIGQRSKLLKPKAAPLYPNMSSGTAKWKT